MPIGISDEHQELHARRPGLGRPPLPAGGARGRRSTRRPRRCRRSGPALAAQGWLGLHVDEAHGGEGDGLAELVGGGRGARAAPVRRARSSPTTLAAAVLQRAAAQGAAAAFEHLAARRRRASSARVALDGALDGRAGRRRPSACSGTLEPVLSAHLADAAASRRWRTAGSCCRRTSSTREERPTRRPDPPRRRGHGRRDRARRAAARRRRRRRGARPRRVAVRGRRGRRVAVVRRRPAPEYAKERRQFGRPIGQFQGVKHRCANMLARTELARAAVVGRGPRARRRRRRARFAVASAAVAHDRRVLRDREGLRAGARRHRLHLGARRARLPAPRDDDARADRDVDDVAGRGPRSSRSAGATRRLDGRPPPETPSRSGPSAGASSPTLDGLDADASCGVALADAGYLVAAVADAVGSRRGRGRAARDRRRVPRTPRCAARTSMIGGWALPPLMVYGTEEQQQRWIPPTLHGEIAWCQLFSEPGAGSDLAGARDAGRAHRRRLDRERPEGLDVDGQGGATGASSSPAPIRRRRSTRASRSSCST